MGARVRDIVVAAARDFAAAWRILAITDLAYKALAFAVLTPGDRALPALAAVADGLPGRRRRRHRHGSSCTTRAGVVALILGGAILVAITALELGCLMAIGLATARGAQVNARTALAFGGEHAGDILRLTGHMVLRVARRPGAVPARHRRRLLRAAARARHQLLPRPQAARLLVAVALGAVIAGRSRGAPRCAPSPAGRWRCRCCCSRASTRGARSAPAPPGRRVTAASSCSCSPPGRSRRWRSAPRPSALVNGLGRAAAPHLAGSLATLLLFLAGLVIVWAVLGIAVAIVNVIAARAADRPALPARRRAGRGAAARGGGAGMGRRAGRSPGGRGSSSRVSRSSLAVGFALIVVAVTRGNQPVLVIAHRGASAAAPENTLAAFRLGRRGARRLRRARRPGVARRRGPGGPRQRPHEGGRLADEDLGAHRRRAAHRRHRQPQGRRSSRTSASPPWRRRWPSARAARACSSS